MIRQGDLVEYRDFISGGIREWAKHSKAVQKAGYVLRRGIVIATSRSKEGVCWGNVQIGDTEYNIKESKIRVIKKREKLKEWWKYLW